MWVRRGGKIEYEGQRARASSDAPKVPRRPAGLFPNFADGLLMSDSMNARRAGSVERRVRGWKPWAAWLVAWAGGTGVRGAGRNAGAVAGAPGDGLEAVLVGINIDTAPCLLWLVLGLLLAPWRFGRLLATGPRGPPAWLRWWTAPAGRGGVGVVISVLLVGAVSLANQPARGVLPGCRPRHGGIRQPAAGVSRRVQLPVPGPHVHRGRVGQPRARLGRPAVRPDARAERRRSVFASRYFPGVGAWMAPFVAWGEPTWGHYLAGVLTAIAVLGIGRENWPATGSACWPGC